MGRKATKAWTVHLTHRALRDIANIELYSVEKFGERVAAQYIGKLEAGISRVSDNAELLREESLFHDSLQFYRIEQQSLVCETGIEDKIIILTVLHASMDFPSRLAELEPKLSIEAEMLLKQLHRSSNRLDVLHDEERSSMIGHTAVKDFGNVWMIHQGQSLTFSLEASEHLL